MDIDEKYLDQMVQVIVLCENDQEELEEMTKEEIAAYHLAQSNWANGEVYDLETAKQLIAENV